MTNLAVEREAQVQFRTAGLGDPAGQVGGEVDLEPVAGERVVPQHHVVIAAA
jgi:hypothetical protein